jgi:signal transduction histidine kinase
MNRFRAHLSDGLLTLALLGVGLGGTAPAAANQGVPRLDWWVYVPVVAAAVAVAGRRRLPRTVLAICAVATGMHLIVGPMYGPIMFSLAVAVYTVAAHLPLRVAAPAAAGTLVVLIGFGLAATDFGVQSLAPVTTWVAAPMAVGVTVRVTREQAVQSRRDDARRQADAERLRVAQEVHDVVGHGLAAITMQADIALHLLAKERTAADAGLSAGATDPAEAALTAISRTSRDSLDELRSTLGVVRRGADADDRTPVAGLAGLAALVDRTRAVGVPVSVRVTGPVERLPAAVDLAAYRIVQESLTNVLRHAGPATAEVRLELADGVLRVEVTDTGRGGPVPRRGRNDTGVPLERSSGTPMHGGHGLTGMRERVTALGGALDAAPVPGGGFAVSATLPVRR